MNNSLSHLNWLAIFMAALSVFIIGGLWYSPLLFAKSWMKENGFTETDMKKEGKPKIFIFSFLFSLIMAFNLAMFLNDDKTTVAWGAVAGFLAGFGWVAMSLFIIGQFERKSTKYMLIHGGYVTLGFVVMGIIIGAWR
jgi:hypothetical protein